MEADDSLSPPPTAPVASPTNPSPSSGTRSDATPKATSSLGDTTPVDPPTFIARPKDKAFSCSVCGWKFSKIELPKCLRQRPLEQPSSSPSSATSVLTHHTPISHVKKWCAVCPAVCPERISFHPCFANRDPTFLPEVDLAFRCELCSFQCLNRRQLRNHSAAHRNEELRVPRRPFASADLHPNRRRRGRDLHSSLQPPVPPRPSGRSNQVRTARPDNPRSTTEWVRSNAANSQLDCVPDPLPLSTPEDSPPPAATSHPPPVPALAARTGTIDEMAEWIVEANLPPPPKRKKRRRRRARTTSYSDSDVDPAVIEEMRRNVTPNPSSASSVPHSPSQATSPSQLPSSMTDQVAGLLSDSRWSEFEALLDEITTRIGEVVNLSPPLVRGIQDATPPSEDFFSVLAFADDLLVLGRSPDELQSLLDLLPSLSRRLGLSINPAKCRSIHLSGTTPRGHRSTGFRIDDQPLEVIPDHVPASFLGTPIGFQLFQNTEEVEKILSLAKKIGESCLAPWQRIDALKSFFFPTLNFAMRTGQFSKEQLQPD
ncbi:hypothetical protein JTE90_013152 [Oedothorax gibbosus]|uniref:C2H2-type domain-containing protein n=1 Tax=Oedothorax gibbosus TaxID=931172 RepID=A0AAV6TPZ8_9ARAC|nr:hypothetical protein JTE90_013152 [Oedothorax gibbosus]